MYILNYIHLNFKYFNSRILLQMMKLVLLCVVGVVVADQGNTRFFGLGNLGGGLGHQGIGGVGGIGGIGGSGGAVGGSSTCRYWCKNPQGQAYCCEGNNQPAGPVGTKSGYCPPVRPSCPPTRFFGGPPQTCSNDYSCPGIDKCCHDTCLGEAVCKPPRGSGGFLG